MTVEVGHTRSSRRDRIAGGLLVLAGVATGTEATTFDVAFMTDPVGPKALPLLVAVTLVLAGLRLVVRPRPSVDLPGAATLRTMGLAAAALITYGVLLPWAGFFVSTSLVVTALGMLFGGPRMGSVAAGIALSSALWLLFVGLLSLPLPIGDLWIR